MARRKRTQTSASPNPPPKTSLATSVKEVFAALTAVSLFVNALLGGLVLYANNKGLFSDLTDDFYGWLYEEEYWNGLFNNYPEGYVDMASMELSETTTQLVLTSHRGQIDGVISDRRLCGVGFPNGYKLLKGEISLFGNSAKVIAWDVEKGYPVDYAEFSIDREGVVIKVTPKQNSRWLGDETLRLAQHPDMDTDQAMQNLYPFCFTPDEEVPYLHWPDLLKKPESEKPSERKPVEELSGSDSALK